MTSAITHYYHCRAPSAIIDSRCSDAAGRLISLLRVAVRLLLLQEFCNNEKKNIRCHCTVLPISAHSSQEYPFSRFSTTSSAECIGPMRSHPFCSQTETNQVYSSVHDLASFLRCCAVQPFDPMARRLRVVVCMPPSPPPSAQEPRPLTRVQCTRHRLEGVP